MTDIVSTEKIEAIVKDTTSEMTKFSKDFLSAYKSQLVEEALSKDGGDSGDSGDDSGEMMAEGEEAKGGDMEEGEDSMKSDAMEAEMGDEPKRELLVRNAGESSDEPLKVGVLTKRGDVRKNWKERYFVVRADFTIEYYENEAKFKAGAKPKGTINLAGYKVVRDPNGRKVEEKKYNQSVYGVTFGGEYTKYEPFTIECYHSLKRRWLMKCENAESFNSWCNMLEKCARKVRSGTLEDEQMQEAFNSAAESMAARLKEKVPCGKESEILTQMLAPRLWALHIGDAAFKDLGAPPALKLKAREKGFQVVYKAVEGAVLASWKTLLATCTAAADKTKEVVAKGINPVRTARQSTSDKVSGAVNDTIEPVKGKLLVPIAKAVVQLLGKISVGPILSVDESLDIAATRYAEARSVGNDCSLKGIKNNNESDMKPTSMAFNDMSASVAGEGASSALDTITSNVEAIGDSADKLKALFKVDEYVNSLQDVVLDNAENAGYTFEKLLEDSMEGDSSKALENKEQVLQSVKEKYRHDVRLDQIAVTGEFLTSLLSSLLFDKVGEVCESICEPFDSLIPEALQDLISISGILGEVLESVVESVVESAITEGLKDFALN